MPVRCRPRFPSRNRRFPDRCRSPDCASTAFRCRCLLLRQTLFVLLRRRLLYPVPNGHTYPLRCFAPQWARFDNRHSISAPAPILTAVSGSGASALFVSNGDSFAPRRELLLSAVTKVAKSTGRNYVSALPQRATPVRCRPRFPSRNRRFPDCCRSPDCASTAFRCRCLLLW